MAGAVSISIVLAAGMLAVAALSGGVTLALLLATRDEAALARREAQRGDPRRPSLAPCSPRENREGLALSSATLALVFMYAFVASWLREEAPNFLRMFSLFSGPDGLQQLSLESTPLPFLLQTALAAFIAIALSVLARVQYKKSR